MKIKRIITENLLFLLIGTLAGFLLLVLAFCLPVEPMKTHVRQSFPTIEREFENPAVFPENPATFVGNFTDCLMMEHAVYRSPDHSFLEQVLLMYRGESGEGDGWAAGFSLLDYLNGIKQPREVTYARYWHGYLIVLKPLLFLTTLPSIRIMAAVIQFILAGVILFLCGRRRDEFLGMAFLVSVPCLYFFVMYFSLSLSICFYIMAVTLIVQLKYHEKLAEKDRYFAFFLIVGMATSYFDFLTYPLITLGYPLSVFLYLNPGSWREQLKKLIYYSTEWCAGYLGLWVMKWILTDLLVGGNTIKDAFDTLFLRTGSAEGYSRLQGFIPVMKQSVEPYGNWGFGFLFLGIILFLAAGIVKNRRYVAKETVMQGAVIFLVALFPVGWIFLTQNHVEEHWMYTFKILSVSVFAGVCAVGKLIGKGGNGAEQEG